MTKNDVIEELSKEGIVEKIVYKLLSSSKNRFDTPDDLIQDIYLLLLEKEDELVISLYNKNQLGYYLLRVARNQLLSKNSPYYTKYIKFGAQSDDLTQATNTITTED